MDAQQKTVLEQRFKAADWREDLPKGRGLLKDFDLAAAELRDWDLLRSRRHASAEHGVTSTLWRRGDSLDALLAVDVIESPSIKAAHDQLLEILGNMESPVIERLTQKQSVGDVGFGHADTMRLFARANVVVWIRNAGPAVVKVNKLADALDEMLMERLEPKRKR